MRGVRPMKVDMREMLKWNFVLLSVLAFAGAIGTAWRAENHMSAFILSFIAYFLNVIAIFFSGWLGYKVYACFTANAVRRIKPETAGILVALLIFAICTIAISEIPGVGGYYQEYLNRPSKEGIHY